MTEQLVAGIAGGLAGFVSGSLVSGGRNIFSTYALWLAGTLVEITPRGLLPDRFVRWYNDALDAWRPPMVSGASA